MVMENGVSGTDEGVHPSSPVNSDNEITNAEQTQTAIANVESENIRILENANAHPGAAGLDAESWTNDPRCGNEAYYQSGKKRGELRPKYADENMEIHNADIVDVAKSKTKPKFFPPKEGKAKNKQTEAIQTDAELRLREARASTVANQALMMLDTINTMVSGGNYSASKETRKETHLIFKDYALMHNFGLPPWLEVSFAAVMYTAPAFMTRPAPDKPSAGEKVKSWFFRKTLGRVFG